MDKKMQKTVFHVVFPICLFLCLALLIGCGASRQGSTVKDDSVDIDELLGEEEVAQSGQPSEEDEVLRLLGITPAEEQVSETDVSPSDQQPEMLDLEDDINQLRQELLKKDQEISELRAELTQKEVKISDLEARAKVPTRPQVPVNGSGKAWEPSPQFKSKYQEALGQFKSRNYQNALSLFSELILSDPNNSLSDNCQYWIGECYFALINYNQAIAEFEKVFSFANSNKSDDAQLKLGICYIKLGDKSQARAEFDRLLSVYPDSEYRSLAQKYIARL